MRRWMMVAALLSAAPALADEAPPPRHVELRVYPYTPQLNGKFAEHAGSAIGLAFRIRDRVALRADVQLNFLNRTSALNQELVDKARESAQVATSTLMPWAWSIGSELAPIDGELTFLSRRVRYRGFLSAGAGLAGTRIEQGRDPGTGAVRHASTGTRLLGQTGFGVGLAATDRVSLRFELAHLFYAVQVSPSDACRSGDLPPTRRPTQDTCWRDSPTPSALFVPPSSDVLNLVHGYAGLGFLF